MEISSAKPDKDADALAEILKKKLSIGDFTACVERLKAFYNISQETELSIKKVEFDAQTDINRANDPYASQGVSYEFIDPMTKQKLNNSLCEDIPIPLKIPFKQSERINYDLYIRAQTIKTVIDLYDKKSPGYSSRCLKTSQFDTGADTSVNYRRERMYQNMSMGCSSGCDYKGVDQNSYIICDCQVSGKNEISNTGEDGSLLKFPSLNYDISLCYKELYENVITNLFVIYLSYNRRNSFRI